VRHREPLLPTAWGDAITRAAEESIGSCYSSSFAPSARRLCRDPIGGNLQAFQNTGGVEIIGNRIDGNLQYKANKPGEEQGRGLFG